MFAYQRIVPSLYIAAFLFILLGCASSNVEGEYTGDGVASNVSTQEGDKLANEMKDANQAQHFANQINRLKSFLRYYCQTYESKDLDKFAALFTPDAIENNRPFYLLLPKYRKNLDMIAANQVGGEQTGFESDTNELNVIWPDGQRWCRESGR